MIYKPESCKKCPAVRVVKDRLICGVYKKYWSYIDDEEKLEYMHKNCLLEWDEK